MSNENKIRIYDSTGSTPVNDPDNLLDRAQNIRFSTGYPGGIFGDASFFIPCDPTRYNPIKHVQRLQIKNGLTTVWEGLITSITIVVLPDRMGFDVGATGYWGLAFHRYKYNRWIDRRTTSDVTGVWEYDTSLNGADKCEFDQNDRLYFIPKNEQWNALNVARVTYNTNGGSSVKRIKFSYDFSELALIEPAVIFHYVTAGATYTTLTNAFDGDPSTSVNATLASTDYLYIGMHAGDTDRVLPAKTVALKFDLTATVNTNAATMAGEYWNGSAWTALTITDGTAAGGKTLAQDGSITFARPGDWLNPTLGDTNKTNKMYIRLKPSANLTAVGFAEVKFGMTQNWAMRLYDNVAGGGELWAVSATGSGTQDITLATASWNVYFEFYANEIQTPFGNSTIYGKITDLVCVAEAQDGTAKTTVAGLLQDMVYWLGSPFLNNYTYMAANTYDLLTTGFVTDALVNESLAEQMLYLSNFSATDAAYSIGVIESDSIGGGNASPVIYYQAYPALTDYDYSVRLDEQNIGGIELVTSADFDSLFNSAFVTFTTPNNRKNWAYSADYAGLTDTPSVTKYSGRTIIIEGGTAATPALAGPFGAPTITEKKNLAYYMRSPLQLRGTIRKKDGTSIPVSQVRAGKRIKIENFNVDVGDVSGAGLTFLISATEYDDDTGTLSVTAGVPDDLALNMARQDVMSNRGL